MPLILLGCACWTVLLYTAAAVLGLGWIEAGPTAHRIVGIGASVFTVASHGLGFTLGIAWARILTEAQKVGALPEALGLAARAGMIRVDAAATLAMFAVIGGAVLGGAADTGVVAPAWHGWGSLTALAIALTATAIEMRAFRAFGTLFDQARAVLAALPPVSGRASDARS